MKHEVNHLKVYSAQSNGIKDIHSVCSYPVSPLISHFRSPGEALDPSQPGLMLPSLWLPATASLLSVPVESPLQGISYKWNRTLCDILCLGFLSPGKMFSRFIHVAAYIHAYSFFMTG